jgi:hypothetical protein
MQEFLSPNRQFFMDASFRCRRAPIVVLAAHSLDTVFRAP